MPTFEVDDQFHSHPKTGKVSLAALGVWVKAGSWCAAYLTDGAVPRSTAINLASCPQGTPSGCPQPCPSGVPLWDELVSAGLVDETPDGYQLHDYLHWNRPATEIRAQRVKAAEKKRDQRAKMRAQSKCPQGTPPKTPRGSTPMLSPGESPVSPSPSPALSHSDQIPPTPLAGDAPRVEAGPEAGMAEQTPERSAAKAPPKPRRPRAVLTVLPDDWTPREAHYAQARAEGGRDAAWVDREAQAMRDWAASKGERSADWDARFRNWIRRGMQDAGSRQAALPKVQPARPGHSWKPLLVADLLGENACPTTPKTSAL